MPVTLAVGVEPIPGYKLIEQLGSGGFADVWKAEAPGGMLKAIKFVRGDMRQGHDTHAAEQELKALERVKLVRHPYVLSLERADVVEGQLCIVMELADRDLMGRFRECTEMGFPGIPRKELLSYLEEAAEALDLMNKDYGLQHLDVKPQNLFLVHNHVKVADFGLVKALEGVKAKITAGLTPLYSAPETFDGWASSASDQYSLAIVYQELLTGKRPFNGTNARQLLMQHLMLPPDLSALPKCDQDPIGRALAKVPEERFPSCGSLIMALLAAGEKSARMPAPQVPALPPGSANPADRLTVHDTPVSRVSPGIAVTPVKPQPAPATMPSPPKPAAPKIIAPAVPAPAKTPTPAAPAKPSTPVPAAPARTPTPTAAAPAKPAAPVPPIAAPPEAPIGPAQLNAIQLQSTAIACPTCNFSGKVPRIFLGKQIRCRGCGAFFTAVSVDGTAPLLKPGEQQPAPQAAITQRRPIMADPGLAAITQRRPIKEDPSTSCLDEGPARKDQETGEETLELIQVTCPNCQSPDIVPKRLYGCLLTCRGCKQTFTAAPNKVAEKKKSAWNDTLE